MLSNIGYHCIGQLIANWLADGNTATHQTARDIKPRTFEQSQALAKSRQRTPKRSNIGRKPRSAHCDNMYEFNDTLGIIPTRQISQRIAAKDEMEFIRLAFR